MRIIKKTKKIVYAICITSILTSFALYARNNITSSNNCCAANCCDCCCDCNRCCLGPCDGYPFLQIRSQGRDAAKELIGWQPFVHQYCSEENYQVFSAAVEYKKSFRDERLTHYYFGSDLVNCCELWIQGDSVGQEILPNTTRNSKSWLADYFGLPSDFESKVHFCPSIQNVIIDLNLYWSLDCQKEGLYVKLNAPLVWTKWELCPCEKIITKGDADFEAGKMSSSSIARDQLATSFLQVMRGGFTFGDMKSPLRYGLISPCGCTKTRLAELDLTLGWDFVNNEDNHFGAFLYVAAPTGNRPCAKYLFEPIVGNGKHWELGGGLSGHWIFWRDCKCEDRYMGIWLEATIAHLFKTCQRRSFDFICKPNSRYMLLEEMTKADGLLTGPAPYIPAEYEYATSLIPAINWSTFNVDVKIPVMADIAIKLGWQRDCWNFDLGYNLYARTGEKFCNCCCNDSKLYAIKGNASLYGAWDTTIRTLSWTESTADIHGANVSVYGPPIVFADNSIDNLAPAYQTDGLTHEVVHKIGTSSQTVTSIQPVLIDRCMLNMGKSPSMITHKLFANINYAWTDRACKEWTPFLGIGGNIEFAQSNWNDCCCLDACCGCTESCDSCICSTEPSEPCCTNSCNASKHNGVSQWGVWLKGGVAFN